MTLDEWMNQVVADFPRPLQQHLRSEYRSHYQDHLEVGGSSDALALFGDPAETKRQLNKLYLTQRAIERPASLFYLNAGLLVLIYSLFASTVPDHMNLWSVLGLVLIPIAVAWLWKHTRAWAPERQKIFRAYSLGALAFIVQGFGMLPADRMGFQPLAAFSILCSLSGAVYTTLFLDARVRRTLDPKGWRDA